MGGETALHPAENRPIRNPPNRRVLLLGFFGGLVTTWLAMQFLPSLGGHINNTEEGNRWPIPPYSGESKDLQPVSFQEGLRPSSAGHVPELARYLDQVQSASPFGTAIWLSIRCFWNGASAWKADG